MESNNSVKKPTSKPPLITRQITHFCAALTLPAILVTGLVFFLLHDPTESKPVPRVLDPQRIVSSTPSTTELLFDIGLGSRIVGDSQFTTYPPEAKTIEKIGGLTNKNREKISTLKPDLVVCLVEEVDFMRQMEQMGLEVLAVNHQSLDGLYQSYEEIGQRFGGDIEKAAKKRRDDFRDAMDRLKRLAAEKKPVRVLLCVDRPHGTGRVQNLIVAGNSPFYRDLILLAGGENVLGDSNQPFPMLSFEGLLELQPDVIVELLTGDGMVSAAEMDEQMKDRLVANALADWSTMADSLHAVKNGCVFIFTEDYATIPSPRLVFFVEKLYKTLHQRGK